MEQKRWKLKFAIIASGQAISLVGSSAVQFALIWWMAEETASPMMLGMSGLVAFLPMTLFSAYAGVMADRHSRKLICIVADMSLGVLALLYALLLYNMEMPIWSVLVVLFLRGVGGAFHQPAIQSIIPQLVPKDQLIRANGVTQLLSSGSFILGPVIGAVLYAAVPLYAVLLTDFAGAVIASGALMVVKVPELVRAEGEKQGFFTQLKEGIAVYKEDTELLLLVVAETLCMVFFMPLSSFYPLMTSDFFNLSAYHGSIVETMFAVGMMIAAFLFGSVLKIKNKISVAYLGLLGVGASSLLCGLLPPVFTGWLLFTAICTLMGAFGNVHSIPFVAYMQETIPPEKMGRAFSLIALTGSLTMPLGLLISSPIAEKTGVHTWFFISGAAILAIIAVFWCMHRKRAKS